MIVEERMYTLHPGKVPEYLKAYKEEGMAIQKRILGNMFGYFFNEVGTQNQIVHMWWYEDFAEREKRRALMAADAGWVAYAAKVRPFLLHQETRIMRPAPFFEETIRKMLAAANP
jgi:NIPSNAP